jgi:hypothetical protein
MFDSLGIVRYEFIPEGKTVNKVMYSDVLRRLKDAVRSRPEKWRFNSWFLLHDNAPAYQPLLAKDFLAKNNVTTLENPPYSSDLAPGDFYLFPPPKSTLKDSACVMLQTSLRMRRKSRKGFHKMTSRNVSNALHSLEEVYSCTRGLF